MYSCVFFSKIYQTGMQINLYNPSFIGGLDGSINSTSSDIDANLSVFGGGGGSLIATSPIGSGNVYVYLYGHGMGGNLPTIPTKMILDGVNVTVYSTADSIPGNITLNGGAPPPILLTPANALNYTPVVLANWNGLKPANVSDALDRIAAKIGPIP